MDPIELESAPFNEKKLPIIIDKDFFIRIQGGKITISVYVVHYTTNQDSFH